MSQGILQTALTNNTLRLELEYREASAPWESDAAFVNVLPRPNRSASEEFADLLSVM